MQGLAEATLALVLFSDASRINLRKLGRGARRRCGCSMAGLPLTIVLGALAAAAIFGQISIEEALIVGVVLAPTDAALGQAVVTNASAGADQTGAERRERSSTTGSACRFCSSRWRPPTSTQT